jgi:hypothetical protein
MVEIEIEAHEFDELPDDLENWGNALMPNIYVAMDQLANELKEWLEYLTWKDSGLTAASWVVIPIDIGQFFITNTNEPVITFITQGTAAHFVAPVFAEALHWVDETGEHFSKGHWVSGIVGEDFESEALEAMEDRIEELLQAAFDATDRAAFGG